LQQHGATSAVAGLRESHNLPLRRMILQNRWNALYNLIALLRLNDDDRKNFLNSFSKMLETHIMITNNDLGFWKKRFLQLSVKFPLVYFLTYKLYYLIDFYIIRKKFFKPKQLNFLKKDI
jgi:hypothetical protein